MSPSEPIDPIHRESIEERRRIRWAVERLRAEVAAWRPRPMPKGWR